MSIWHNHFARRILLFLFASAILIFAGGPVRIHAQGAPTLGIRAPKKVDVGQPIKITLRLKAVNNIAGYEMNVRYDSTAAHLTGIHQRNNGLKKIGREVVPLQIEQPEGGVAIGLASCSWSDCVQAQGAKQEAGGTGKFLLATLLIGTDQAGPLEIRFDSAKFVDAAGNRVEVAIPRKTITVQVGEGGNAHSAAPSPWQLADGTGRSPAAGALDRTHDNQVSYSDVMEFAIAWTDLRFAGAPCGDLPDAALDLNGDGCLDVADVQIAASNANSVAQSEAANAPLTLVVNTTNDAADATPGDGVCNATGGCTLRAAIDEANAHTGPDSITFNIPGSGVQTINLKTVLPGLGDASGPTTINGYTQPGATPNTNALASNAHLLIQINGQGPGAFDAFRISAPNNVVRGFAIYNVRRSFYIYGAGARSNIIAGNFIGTDVAAQFFHTVSVVNANGVHLANGANNNRIGTPALADRNVISGNSRHGIGTYFEGTNNNLIQNNIIGLSPSGDRQLKNFKHGIDINSASQATLIGGNGANERNIISGNGDPADDDFSAGVEISHDTLTVHNKIIGNCIGTDLSCNSAPAYARPSHYGIRFEDGANNNEIANNVIVNTYHGGIQIDNYYTEYNSVHDNRIGLTANGTAAPNNVFGVRVKYHGKHNTIGPNNIIANNPAGVIIEYLDDDFNTITRNSIFNNTNLGIDLGPSAGVSYNDSGDTDTGANEGLNYPVITNATTNTISGTGCGEAAIPKPCTIEIFIVQSTAGNSGGGQYGQGKTFLAGGSSNGSFSIPVSGVSAGALVTATSTDAQGNTSEFSKNVQVTQAGGPTPTLAPTTPPPTPTPSGSTTYAQDAFGRTLVNGWGSANIGGAYSLSSTPGNFDVNGSEGTIVLNNPNATRSAYLLNVSAQNVDAKFRVKVDKVATGGSQIAYFVVRHVNANTHYLGRIRFANNGSIRMQAVAEVNGVQTVLGGEKLLSGTTQTANTYYWIRGQVTGTNPTTIKLRMWQDGQAEPSTWSYSVTDSSAELQAAGGVGLRAYVSTSASNTPNLFTFDNFRIDPAP